MASSIKKLTIVSALVVALISLFSNYPGFLYTDSFIRWDQAKSLIDGEYIGGDFLTIAPSLLFSFVLFVTGNPAAYSFLQAFFLCFVFLCLLVYAGGRERQLFSLVVALLLYMSTPQFIAYGLTHAPGVGVAISMVGITVLLLARGKLQLSFFNYSLLLAFLSFVCFGFRQNALVLLPLFLLLVWWGAQFTLRQKTVVTGVFLLAALFCLSLPSVLNWKTSNQLAKSIAWEMACLVKDSQGNLSEHSLAPIGVSSYAIKNVDCYNVLTLAGPKMATKSDVKAIYGQYLQFIKDEPGEFLVNKLRVWSRVLGISRPLEVTGVVNEWPELARYGGYQKSENRSNFVRYYHGFHAAVPVFRYPYLLMSFAAFLLVAAYRRNKESDAVRLAFGLYIVATAYYLSFFLVAQRHEVRYFFPSAFVYIATIGMSTLVILGSYKLGWLEGALQCIKRKCHQSRELAITLSLALLLLWIIGIAALPRISAFGVPQYFEVSAHPLNDMNWENGVSLNTEVNIILMRATPRNVTLMRGLGSDSVIANGNVTASIDTVIFTDDQWIHVAISGPKITPSEWGYPRKLRVSR